MQNQLVETLISRPFAAIVGFAKIFRGSTNSYKQVDIRIYLPFYF